VHTLLLGRPSPSTAPLASGIAPDGRGKTRLFSTSQLEQLDAWLRVHKSEWSRQPIPPAGASHGVELVHSDGTTTHLLLFSQNESWRRSIYFRKFDKDGKSDDAGWLFRPVEELDHLKALLFGEMIAPASATTGDSEARQS
jgi:hypothetical protein